MEQAGEFSEVIAKHLRERQGRPVSVRDMAEELDIPERYVLEHLDELLRRDHYFDLGDMRAMYSGDANIAAFEIFRSGAPNITYEEFLRFREQPHVLMRMSRDREIEMGSDHEKRLQNAVKDKRRGNSVF